MAKVATFDLEFKIRYLTDESLTRVVAIYDCCRHRIEGIKGLAGAVEGRIEQINLESDSENEEKPC